MNSKTSAAIEAMAQLVYFERDPEGKPTMFPSHSVELAKAILLALKKVGMVFKVAKIELPEWAGYFKGNVGYFMLCAYEEIEL